MPLPPSAQLIRFGRGVEDGDAPGGGGLDAVVLEHLAVDAGVVALDGEGGLGDGGGEDEVVVAVRAVLVGLLELLRVLAEALAALLARERHLERPQQLVRLLLPVALGAVEPLPACVCVRVCVRVSFSQLSRSGFSPLVLVQRLGPDARAHVCVCVCVRVGAW